MCNWQLGEPPKRENVLIKRKGRPITLMDYDEESEAWLEPFDYHEANMDGPIWWAAVDEPKED